MCRNLARASQHARQHGQRSSVSARAISQGPKNFSRRCTGFAGVRRPENQMSLVEGFGQHRAAAAPVRPTAACGVPFTTGQTARAQSGSDCANHGPFRSAQLWDSPASRHVRCARRARECTARACTGACLGFSGCRALRTPVCLVAHPWDELSKLQVRDRHPPALRRSGQPRRAARTRRCRTALSSWLTLVSA